MQIKLLYIFNCFEDWVDAFYLRVICMLFTTYVTISTPKIGHSKNLLKLPNCQIELLTNECVVNLSFKQFKESLSK